MTVDQAARSRHDAWVGTAILGMVGVVIGALVAGGAQLMVLRREDRYARRAAIRLLCLDFHKVLAVTRDVPESGAWGPERDPLPQGAFDSHAATLARMLPPVTWKKVEGSVLGVQRMEGIRVEMLAEHRDANPDEISDFRRIRDFIARSLDTLDAESWAIERGPTGDAAGGPGH